MLKSNFFSAKNFNIFYDFGREKNPTSAIRSPIKPRNFPIKPRNFPIKHLEIPRCFVLHPLYWPKKEEKVPCFRALSSSLVQRYNIFPRNPNRVNISQHFGNVKNEVFYLEFIMMAVSMKRQCTARCSQRVAPRNYCTIGGVAIAAPSYSLYIRCHFRGATRCKQRAVHCLAMGTNSFSIRN